MFWEYIYILTWTARDWNQWNDCFLLPIIPDKFLTNIIQSQLRDTLPCLKQKYKGSRLEIRGFAIFYVIMTAITGYHQSYK